MSYVLKFVHTWIGSYLEVQCLFVHAVIVMVLKPKREAVIEVIRNIEEEVMLL